MRRLILKDSEWLRGKYAVRTTEKGVTRPASFLLRPDDGRMCCLGVDARSRGIPDEFLEGSYEPADLSYVVSDHRMDDALEALPGEVEDALNAYLEDWGGHTEDTGDLIVLNDDPSITDEERLKKMRPIFKRHGIQLIFMENR